ncbi:MAG TPA: toll/interleukin-1 receptor domain-containing protein, partial [Aggregatilineales bacterium]|nr:toll/interleukin-1 receptor domain-containing protein [Aggregatilineales bacterium]
VFISYRRTNQAHAIKIYQLLQESGYDPFLDVKDMGSGAWRVIIQREIERRAHFMLLLTPSAVERFVEPNDVMRFEIETALTHKRNLVPLMFEGFSYSDPRIRNYLTGKLAILSEYNAFPINWRRLKKDVQELTARFMSVHPDDVVHPSLNEETRRETNASTDLFGGVPKEESEEADGIVISPDVGSSGGDMPDWLSDDEVMDSPDMDELLMPEAEAVIDDNIAVEKEKKEDKKLSELPRQQATTNAPVFMPQPATLPRKSGGSPVTTILMSVVMLPVWAVGRVYVVIRDLINPRPSTTGTTPPPRHSAEPPLSPKPAPAPVVKPAEQPAYQPTFSAPPPQSKPVGASS